MSGRTVISTIHQPNSDIFDMFDRLMLLAQGKIIYYNEAKLAVDYFAGVTYQGHSYKCPELSNPADYFMSIMSIESQEQEDFEMDGSAKPMKTQAEVYEEYTRVIDNFHQNY